MNQLTLGFERKEAGQRVVRSNCAEWMDLAERFVACLEPDASVDAELIRQWVGAPPRPNAMGALLSTLQKRKLIVRTGYRQATRASRHAAEIKTFQRTEHEGS